MPGENIWDWSTTALNNGTADSGINWAEGQTRASVNNSARGMMAALAKWRNLNNGSITTGGTANAQTFTSGVGFTSVQTGLRATLTIGAGLTNAAGGTTLNMDGIGAVTIKYGDGTDIYAGALRAGFGADLIYNGTNWILLPNVPSVTIPTQQIFTSGSGTYSTPAGVKWIKVRLIGAGGGGGGVSGGGTGGSTTFGSLTGSGGTGGASFATGVPGSGGAASGGDVNLVGGGGGPGAPEDVTHAATGGMGGSGAFGGAGRATIANSGLAGAANTGGGGAGGGIDSGAANPGPAGGGSGGYVEKLYAAPAGSYSYAVGAGGTAGGAGGGVYAGGLGGSGIIIVEEHYI